jgi:hypothetical protein
VRKLLGGGGPNTEELIADTVGKESKAGCILGNEANERLNRK